MSYGTISGKWEIWGAESKHGIKGQLCSRDGILRAWQGSNSGDVSTLHISLCSGSRNSTSARGACEESIRKGTQKGIKQVQQ
jgi:hypothetical protein